MENRTYYGEYSLKHWIALILKKNLVLPDYQRYFVWEEKDVTTLIKTLKAKEFVPPVTIGAFKFGNTSSNLILDGQQRLTSILLTYLGIFPDPQIFKSTIEELANERDEDEEEEDGDLGRFDNILEWNLNLLTEKGNNKQDITSKLLEGNYKSVVFDVDNDFFESTYLGFSYLVPQATDEKEQLKYYSSVFRNINVQGKPLLPQESRAALYFLDNDLVSFFNPEFCKTIVVKLVSTARSADFVRYLSLIAQYHKSNSEGRVARGYKSKMEKYYEEYIFDTINDNDSSTYGKFSEIIPDKDYGDRLGRLKSTIEFLAIQRDHGSIIDVDCYLFGLVYIIIYKDQSIDLSNVDQIQKEIQEQITSFKSDESHKKSPNNLGHLRSRIRSSINIYNGFTQ